MATTFVKRCLKASALAVLVCLGAAGCDPASPSVDGSGGGGPSVHFTAAGDVGLGDAAGNVLDKMAELKPDLNLAVGDFSYQAGAEGAFCDMVTGRLGKEFPYELIAGNHESDGSDGDIGKFVKCLPNRLPGLQGEYGKQWYVDVPQDQPLVRFILISPGLTFQDGVQLDYSKGSERLAWTESAINGAREAKIPWTVVAMHKLCFSMGRYDCDVGEPLTNMLISKNVDLVVTGHQHAYQRTNQLRVGDRCSYIRAGTFDRNCVADTDSKHAQGNGTVFVTAGTGGYGLHGVNGNDTEAGYFKAWSGANNGGAFGVLDVTVNTKRLDAKFVPAQGSLFKDSFVIQR
ncbi:metallophosphoesterase [Arthrobacter sp. 754]|uniref:metallophosphoesterase n=1 Tax=Arthrobacter sp. 754 TaxID=3156315 RepID=UPI003399AB49